MATAKKLDSIGLRISTENKEIIRAAASCTGQDLTSYLISTALERAKKDILEHRQTMNILLSDSDFEKVISEQMKPSKANDRLKRAMKAHKEKFEE